MQYITTKEAAAKWGICTSRITILANEGRIPGAQRLGKSWLIPAGATKPPERKANHSRSVSKEKETNSFSFPLYYFRTDWDEAKAAQLSEQQKSLLLAETAVLECRFAEACPLLESILRKPEDTVTEIGCLWNMGLCCIALNKPDDFFKVFLRLQLLFAVDFPHRDDLVIILETLKTYLDTIGSSANSDTFNTDIHEQALPLECILIAYAHLSREAVNSGTADTTLLELNLRFLKTTGSVIAIEMLHCHLLGIYSLRQNMAEAEKHAKAVVQLAYENKFYFPLVTYYRYFSPALSAVLDRYPQEFQKHCHELISQYDINFTAFFASINDDSIVSKLTDEDYPYIFAALTDRSNSRIARKLGISSPTVKNRVVKLCERLGVSSRKELKEYLLNYM